jgi:hypothetical protein
MNSIMIGTLFFQSCAKEKEKTDLYQIDSEFSSFVQTFEATSVTQGADVSINDLVLEFGSTPTMNETGVCEITEGETPRVTINERIWTNLNTMDRQEVIFHELGHCVLRRKHQDGTVTVGGYWGTIPSSIMYPYRIPGSIYEPNQEFYDEELFDTSKKNQF